MAAPDHVPLGSLSAIPLFADLPEAFVHELALRCRVMNLAPGEVLTRGSEIEECVYIVLQGTLHAFIERDEQQILVGHVGAGETAGEFGFLTADHDQETIIAIGGAKLLALPAARFQQLAQMEPVPAAEFSARLRRRLERWHLVNALNRSPIFRDLDIEVLLELESEVKPLNLAGGEYLFHEGDEGGDLYLLVSGKLHLSTPGRAHVSEIGPGETVGESNMLGNTWRGSTVRATRDSILACLSREGFERILRQYPARSLVFFTRRLVESELQSAKPRSSLPARTVALVPAHADFPIGDFARQLAACVSSGNRRALVLDAQGVDDALGRQASQCDRGSPRDGLLTTWLNAKELDYDCVFLVAEPSPSAWTQRTLRQADRVLLLADGSQRPHPECFRNLSLTNQQPVSLVLLHAAHDAPTGTMKWLNVYAFERHFHLRRGEMADLLRLSRYLSGREVGVVLGGGFARGIAHIGVLRAMRELGIPVDVIGGTSMGSMIAMMHVFGFSDSEMVSLMREQGDSALRDLTFPFVSLLSGRRVRQLVEAAAARRRIEDLPLPAFCVATDLTNGCIAVLRRGLVSEAVLASTRVPGMFPPMVRGDRLLVDGGLVSNVPADVMRGICTGRIIAVDISPETEFSLMQGNTSDVSGWHLLSRMLNPFAPKISAPSIGSVLMRSISFDSESYRQRMRELSDLYLTPPTAGYRFNDFARGEEMAQMGYEYALPLVRRWLGKR